MANPQYISTADAKVLYGIVAGDTDKDAAITAALKRASELIDRWTRTWFDTRAVTIRTKAVTEQQKRLFMPAHIISITSVKEDGDTLAADEYIVADSWLEKPRSFWFCGDETVTGVSVKYGIEIVGSLGYMEGKAEVPQEIQGVTAEIGNIMGGFKTRSIIQDDGVERAIILTDLPPWAQDVIGSHTLGRLKQQPMVIV